DLKSGTTKQVNVRIAGDLLELRDHFVNVGKRLQNAHISPTGARAVFQAHGEILTVPAEKGDARNLTNSSSVMERDPPWSPDGKTIAYFSDEGGEYALHIRASTGKGSAKIYKLSGAGFYEEPTWSPDGKKIAFIDNSMSLFWIDLEGGKVKKIALEPQYG